MELNITRFFNNAAPMDYSASVAEIGADAGRVTWTAAMDDAADYNVLPDENARAAFREYVKGFGAWSDEEIFGWSDQELNALCMQMIAGDMRESGLDLDADNADWEAYEADDRLSHRIFRADSGEIYFYIGN